ncbi:MAG: S9 family peptidase [Anaerolineaceae bacterium]|nr:S9 family peptidase [Anaerolineaceae bacterium]
MPKSISFPIEEVATLPLPGTAVPGGLPPRSASSQNLAFTPDDQLITYLYSPQGTLQQQLYVFDPATGAERLLAAPPEGGTTEENVSPEEALRRERMRLLSQGIPQFYWAPQANRMLIPMQGDIYVIDGVDSPMRKVVDAQGKPALDPQFSPDGDWIAYIQDGEVYVASARPGEKGQAHQVTHGAREAGKTNGLADFLAQEEMDRKHGFWWSPDSLFLAFEEVDESHIPVYRITHPGKDVTGPEAQEDHHYPFAGMDNPRIRLGVISREGGDPVWMDLRDADEERYLCRVDWLPDGRLTAQLENREQTRLELVRYDPATGQAQVLLVEESRLWINLNDLFTPLRDGSFIWGSERTGFQHLYLYDRDARLVHPLTQGEWVVGNIAGVDEQRRRVYFTANRESPLEDQLYRVSLDGGEARRITPEAGAHSVTLDHACRRFVDTYHSVTQPPVVRLRSLEDASILATIYAKGDPRLESRPLVTPELVSLKNRVGTTLYGAIFRPPESFGKGPHPSIVCVYGGPHVQLVANKWFTTVTMRGQYLAHQGYLVFMLDNRGSARRGLEFEGSIWHNLGLHEVEDQVDGVRWLVQQGLTDPKRVGIYGWSYGGYLSAMSLARAPETFQVAVAGAPVTHQGGYDTHYTERYMGLPQKNPEGYQDSSVMAHVENMIGNLLLVHGLIDENVHFRHTARLINALIRAHKPYELLVFPDERHTPRRQADRVYMEERVAEFFLRNLPVHS